VLAKADDPAVRAYVVWVPMNRGLERDVANATKEIWDPRARHYWDGGGQLIASYRGVLGGYTEPVWDTYVLYGKDAKWEGDAPPKPAFCSMKLSAIEKHPACAAASSSSGLLPFSSPKRVLNE